MTPDFLQLLARLKTLEGQIAELTTRVHPLQVAVVTDNNDPTGKRRIRVTRENQVGQSQTDWIQAGRSSCVSDEPLPLPGTTVLIGFSDSDPHDAYLIRTLTNNTNPPDTKQASPTDDNTVEIPGNDRMIVTGDRFHGVSGKEEQEIDGDLSVTCEGTSYKMDATKGAIDIHAAKTVTIHNDAGASLTLLANGSVLLKDAFGHTWTLGGSGGGTWEWSLNGAAVDIIGASDVRINGKSIVVVGSSDDDGDINNDRGY